MRILNVGPLWRGSNAGGLFRALARAGAFVEVIDEFYYVSLKTTDRKTKVMERFLRPLQVAGFNNAITRTIDTFKPDVLLVYKGVFVLPQTLQYAKAKGCRPVLFYPDVSTTVHGPHIPKSIPEYNTVFTTKTFGIRDMQQQYGVKDAVFIAHGFDPDIHRPFTTIGADERAIFSCDASFIGTWSPKKEQWLTHLIEQLPELKLKVWGDQWGKVSSAKLAKCVQGKSVTGDLYALAIQCSTINLGILSEQVAGASSGDLITSRTFHIPGASGFMLHERNEESVLYYREEEEAAFFDGPEEMVRQIKKYLADAGARERIRLAGHKRAMAEHALDARAAFIINHLNSGNNG
jgi:spore maturation protein CgeB